MSEQEQAGGDEDRDKERRHQEYELIRNNEVMAAQGASGDEMRAWLAVLWLALCDLARAYREFAWSAQHSRTPDRPRMSDPVYAWAARVARAVPAGLRDGVPADALASVEDCVRAVSRE